MLMLRLWKHRASLCEYQTCTSWSKLSIKLSWANGSNCMQANNTSLHWWFMPELSDYWLRMYKRLWQHHISSHKWAKVSKYYVKSLFTLSGKEASDLLEKQITYLRAHYYRKHVQSKEYTKQVYELSQGEMVVHVDYSDNYKNKQKIEIKAAYYGQGIFSLYTVVLYIKDKGVVKSRSFALVIEENDHSFNISYDLNKFTLTLIRNEVSMKHVEF